MSRKIIILTEREQRLIERWQMRAINRLPELQFLLMKQIVLALQEEGLEPRLAHLVECPSSGVSHIIYDFDYSNNQRFDVEFEYIREGKYIEFKPFYLNENANIIYTHSIKAVIETISEHNDDLKLKKILQNYFEVFPEIEDKCEIFEKNSLPESEKIEQFLIYTYWYFDEYYTEYLKTLNKNSPEFEAEQEIGEIWQKSIFQLEFFMENKRHTTKFSEMTYTQFSDYSSNPQNHKLDFFKTK